MTRVADDILGKLARQQNDIFRRVRDGSLDPNKVFLQHKRMIGRVYDVFTCITFSAALGFGQFDVQQISHKFSQEVLPEIHRDNLRSQVSLRTRADITMHSGVEVKTTATGWLSLLDDNPSSDEKFAHPLSVLAIAEQYSSFLEENPILTIWRHEDTVWFLQIDKDKQMRRVFLWDPNPTMYWMEYVRVAVVDK